MAHNKIVVNVINVTGSVLVPPYLFSTLVEEADEQIFPKEAETTWIRKLTDPRAQFNLGIYMPVPSELPTENLGSVWKLLVLVLSIDCSSLVSN